MSFVEEFASYSEEQLGQIILSVFVQQPHLLEEFEREIAALSSPAPTTLDQDRTSTTDHPVPSCPSSEVHYNTEMDYIASFTPHVPQPVELSVSTYSLEPTSSMPAPITGDHHSLTGIPNTYYQPPSSVIVPTIIPPSMILPGSRPLFLLGQPPAAPTSQTSIIAQDFRPQATLPEPFPPLPSSYPIRNPKTRNLDVKPYSRQKSQGPLTKDSEHMCQAEGCNTLIKGNQSDWTRHLKMHLPGRDPKAEVSCPFPLCGHPIQSRNMSKHICNVHLNSNRVTCPRCGTSYKDAGHGRHLHCRPRPQ
ncbi:hypothetical protein C8Q75DRAFT_510663 [Abortiporus biennis]|nr:hypothetical protein C8Q75DRAFT_510663 [Abortiporus biennis]